MDLTVAICMYNAERYVEETLAAVVAQTMQEFHLLIVNDCSTDGSVAVVERFFQTHPRQYELVSFDENQGICYARNFALNHAPTRYLVFVDSDDIPLPQLLEKEYAVISADQQLTAVSCWSEFVDTNSNRINGGLYIGDTTKEAFAARAAAGKRIFLPIQTMMVCEDAIAVGGFECDSFPDGKPRYRDFCEDLDLWTRLSDLYADGKYIVSLPEVLYRYRKGDGLSSNHFNMIIKMEYTKHNVRRRRRGLANVTFVEFLNTLSPERIERLKKDSLSADALKNAVFYLHKHKYWSAVKQIYVSVRHNPGYIVDKIRHNLIK